MSHVRLPSRETAGGGPAPGLDQEASIFRELYGQDFNRPAGSADNQSPLRYANTDVLDRFDPLAIANRARVLRGRELRRLFIAAVAWAVNAVARRNTRHGQRRDLGDLPDQLLRDIGIRRDQINAMVSGSLKRGTRL